MKVIKRNGEVEDFNFEKLSKVIEFAIQTKSLREDFLSKLKINLKDRMTTKELQRTLIKLAEENIKSDTPQYDTVAARFYLYDLYKEAGLNRGYSNFGYGNFGELLSMLIDKGLYDPSITQYYSAEDVEELAAYIKPERDYLLSYVGVTTLATRYDINGYKGEVYELPQEAFMGNAMVLATVENDEERVHFAKRFYDRLSLLNGVLATPTMSNARKQYGQFSSCFIGTPDDRLESIMNVGELFSEVSKNGGGMGAYIGKIRAMNSYIKGYANKSGGQVPWVKIYDAIAVACNQLGIRKGAINLTNDAWHRDIFSFLDLKTDNGDLKQKAFNVFLTVSLPDLFYRQLMEGGKWYLFCPHEIEMVKGYRLEDFYDERKDGGSFTDRYWDCVNDDRIRKTEVEAVDLLEKIIESTTETGVPFLFNRDVVNRANPNKHEGIIYCTNLCVEIAQNTKPNGEVVRARYKDANGKWHVTSSREAGDLVVCNLSSIALGRVHTEAQIAENVPDFIRMMDNVITLNEKRLPVEEAIVTNLQYRAVGLGTYDYHHMLAMNKVPWESDKHLEFADTVYENIAFYAIKASMELARQKGAYEKFPNSEWHTGEYFVRRGYVARNANGVVVPIEGKERWFDLCVDVMTFGIRNAYLMAVAPNGSSAHYGNGTQSIDPIFRLVYTDEKSGQFIPVVATELGKINPFAYKEAHKIDQEWSVRANAVRQRHIDQSQSFNIYITDETTAEEIADLYLLAWELEVKTIYYTRNLSMVFDLDDCEACKV
ncbi:ribonucleoside-diphosphate reductase subunit alpha [Paenibacillus chitinolyticus]|uniref:ribonucleoside-diphosphate reductase subunit alpha n=1 Tax=Paenibacillus chitinolyticus TaxID=79263 RepID=UPI003D07D1E8